MISFFLTHAGISGNVHLITLLVKESAIKPGAKLPVVDAP
jgi:hypothetical protein